MKPTAAHHKHFDYSPSSSLLIRHGEVVAVEEDGQRRRRHHSHFFHPDCRHHNHRARASKHIPQPEPEPSSTKFFSAETIVRRNKQGPRREDEDRQRQRQGPLLLPTTPATRPRGPHDPRPAQR